MNSQYDKLANAIIKNLGGSSNIASLTHCVTRLRVVLKDESKIQIDALNATEGVAGTIKGYGQYMIIIGIHVADVYDAVCKAAQINTEHDSVEKSSVKQTLFQLLVSIMTGVFAPFFGVLAACGILKGLLPLLVALGVLDTAGSTYNILYSLADGFFYYMPILLSYTASKYFDLPVIEGLAIGAGMLYPNLLSSSAVLHNSLFGIPIVMPPGGDYTSTAIPIIAAIAFAAWFEKKYSKHLPSAIRPFLVPLITCSVTFIVTLLAIGPITVGLTKGLSLVFNYLDNLNTFIFSGILGFIWQLILMTGMHYAVLPIILTNLSTLGFDTTLSSTFGCNFAQIGAVLAIRLKTNNAEIKKKCFPSIIPAAAGVIEPALYGITLKKKRVFIITCLVSGITGIGMTLSGAKAYRLAGFGIFGYSAYANPQISDYTDLIWAIVWSLIAIVLSFLLVFFTYADEPTKNNTITKPTKSSAENSSRKYIVSAPLSGTVLNIKEVNDPVFSSETLGKGCAITPTNNIVTAPFDGVIDFVADTKHAIGITSPDGIQVLIHVGIDTVKLNGQGFETMVTSGQKVKCGDKLLQFDSHLIKKSHYQLIVPVVVLNSDEYSSINLSEGAINHGQKLLELSK